MNKVLGQESDTVASRVRYLCFAEIQAIPVQGETAKYREYQEAWHLLRGETPGFVDRIEACAEEELPLQKQTQSGHRENASRSPRDWVSLQGSFDYACGFMKRIRMLRSG